MDHVTKYRLLLELNNVIVKETTRDGLFSALAVEIGKIFHFDRFSINLYDSQDGKLRYFAAAEGISPAGLGGERELAKGAIANAVIRSKKPFIIEDLSDYTFWESVRAMKSAGLNATMAYPLIVRDRLLGTLHFSFVKIPPDLNETVDFLTDLSKQVAIAVDNMLSHTQLSSMNAHLKRQKDFLLSLGNAGLGMDGFYYGSAVMKNIMEQVRKLAESEVSVLITGETGTGKDHIARCLHALSRRRDALLVKVNCPALTATLFESELFGHTRGAYTGAHHTRLGRFEMADGGTVFLDEIGELDITLQAKLLNVLQDRIIERVGDNRAIPVDFRLVSATNKDLETSLGGDTFRRDLYYRINSYTIHIPPLRERKNDIPLLVKNLTDVQAGITHRPAPKYSSSCLEMMVRYAWPGNVRELKNIVKRLVLMRAGEVITGRDIENIIGQVQPDHAPRQLTLAELERQHIFQTLARTGGRVGGPGGAAALLGVPRQTLQYRMKKYGIIAKG